MGKDIETSRDGERVQGEQREVSQVTGSPKRCPQNTTLYLRLFGVWEAFLNHEALPRP